MLTGDPTRNEGRTSCRIHATAAVGGMAPSMTELKKHWVLNQDAFRRFLAWLDAGVDSGGESYLEMRRRLVLYFDRKNCISPDDLADETLNRIARKLEEKGEITGVSPAHYCYIVAKYVFLESVRDGKHTGHSVDALTEAGITVSALTTAPAPDADDEAREKMMDCLERCMTRLPQEEQEIILEYYRGEKKEKIERRGGMAVRLGVTMNALSIRACRIRSRLETCLNTCSQGA